MLKRLYIDNFRCFVNFEYKPERKQLLLGANGSGKSSLLDAIRALKTFIGSRGNEFENQKEFMLSRTRWLHLPSQVFEIELEIAGARYVYRLENDVSNPDWPASSVAAESLKVDGTPIFEVANGKAALYTEGNPKPTATIGMSNSGSALALLSANRKEAGLFTEWIAKQLFCLRINPDSMHSSGRFDGQRHPVSDVSDLASWYLQIASTDIDGVVSLRESLQGALEGFTSLQLNGLDNGVGELRGNFNCSGKAVPLALSELSEGQRCLIALCMIQRFLIGKGSTVFLDEPDNFISLREIQPWLLQAEAAVDDSKGQLILISHHPEILNQWAQEYGLRFFREENGHVRTEKFRPDPDGFLRPSELIARGWENE